MMVDSIAKIAVGGSASAFLGDPGMSFSTDSFKI